ncbi:sigma-70 family RNA polymerase sigma factor [Streptomyces sp. NPDC058695]|uniref:sigma-70 family RNA polymerase sigma factor n=1 Tax=Streptomyces sp. NPDC058695 TaxID=3346604 RepID=UPI00365336D6
MTQPISIGPNPAHGPNLPVLMGQVALGDQEAFAAVYDAGSDAVFGLVCKVLRDRAQAEEVTQEVWVEAWRTAGRYRADRGSVLNWLLTLAHRRAVDRIRAVESAAARDHRAALLEQTPAFDEVSEQVQAHHEREELRRCLRSLSEMQRQSVTLAYYQGLTYKEVSEELSTPLGTIKTRLRDGLIRLRDCLGVTA